MVRNLWGGFGGAGGGSGGGAGRGQVEAAAMFATTRAVLHVVGAGHFIPQLLQLHRAQAGCEHQCH